MRALCRIGRRMWPALRRERIAAWLGVYDRRAATPHTQTPTDAARNRWPSRPPARPIAAAPRPTPTDPCVPLPRVAVHAARAARQRLNVPVCGVQKAVPALARHWRARCGWQSRRRGKPCSRGAPAATPARSPAAASSPTHAIRPTGRRPRCSPISTRRRRIQRAVNRGAGAARRNRAGGRSLRLVFPGRPGVLAARSLVVKVVGPTSRMTAVRVDAEVVWVIPRPASEPIAASVREIDVVSGPPRGVPAVSITVTKATTIAALASLISSLATAQRSAPL